MLTDLDHANILSGVRTALGYPSSIPAGIWGFGPVYPHAPGGGDNALKFADCYILVDKDNEPNLPNFVSFTDNGQNWKIFLTGRKKPRYRMSGSELRNLQQDQVTGFAAAGQVEAVGTVAATSATAMISALPAVNTAPSPLFGGDAIFNSTYLSGNPGGTFWGTIAFIGGPDAKIKQPATSTQTYPEIAVGNACVSCAHVMHHRDGGDIRTHAYNSGLSFDGALDGWPSNAPFSWPHHPAPWPDLANAKADASVKSFKNRIRALGELTGVAEPERGDVLAKYGATTGLSVARDIGLVWRRLPDSDGDFFLVRAVSNQFSRPGDSGAAVVYAGHKNPGKYRKLAGFVLAGTTEDDEQYYLPALPMRPAGTLPAIPDISAVEVSL